MLRPGSTPQPRPAGQCSLRSTSATKVRPLFPLSNRPVLTDTDLVTGGAPVRTWVIRACAVQGVQQIYISGLWYWGSQLSSYDSNGIPVAQASNTLISAVCFPVAVLLMALSVVTFFGLPEYYRQTPGSIPSFFKSIFRRKLILVRPRSPTPFDPSQH